MIIWPVIGSAAAALTMFGFVPQVLKMYRRKSVDDVSILTFFQFAAGVACWILYGIHLRDAIIVTANGVTLATLVVAISLYFLYRD